METGETLVDAALRETQEEWALLTAANVLGFLDDFVTAWLAMTPVVVWGGPGLATHADPAEVASVHRIPLREFCRDDAPQLSYTDSSDHPIRMLVGDDAIAAPTAALIYQFREVCLMIVHPSGISSNPNLHGDESQLWRRFVDAVLPDNDNHSPTKSL